MTGFKAAIQAIHDKKAPPAPYDAHMGFRLLELGDGRAVLEGEASARFHNPTGVTHGGIHFGLSDSAMAFALSTKLEPGETCTSIEAKISFLRPLVEGRVTAEGRVVRAGRSICFTECELKDARGEVVAKVTSTFARIKADRGAEWTRPAH